MTKQGLNSICRLSHSPEERSSPTIGENGLGFKSVLILSRTPESRISNLHCKFGIQVGFKFTYSSKSIGEKMTVRQ